MTSLSLYTKLEILPSELKAEGKIFIEKLTDKSSREKDLEPNKAAPKRKFGSLKGKIHLSADFDAPLVEFKDFM